MEMSFWAAPRDLRIVQNNVKRFDGRFVCNPHIIGKRAHVVVSFDNMEDARQFSLRCTIMDQPFF